MIDRIDCYIPFEKDSGFSKFFKENSSRAIDDILKVTEIVHDGQRLKVSAKASKPKNEYLAIWKLRSGINNDDSMIWVRFSISVSSNREQLLKIVNNYDSIEEVFEKLLEKQKEKARRAFCVGAAEEALLEGLRILLFALNISIPGVATTGHWVITGIVDFSIDRPFTHLLDIISEQIESEGYKPLQILPFKETYTWVVQNKISSRKLSNKKVCKALNAFSHLFQSGGYNTGHSDILWALLGIEAIYGEKGNVQKSLRQRVPKLIGLDVSEKTITDLYGARSDYIHGRIPIANIWSSWSLPIQLGKKQTRLDDVSSLAVYILFRSIQELAIQKANDVHFVENLEVKIET